MAVGSSFDHWQKDVFFSAAEEVQESADALESLYRIWMRYLKDGFPSGAEDELHRELHIALGTAKWQLEEFEKAVRLSHENYPSEANTITRHEHFMEAIGNQISRIEKALRDEGKQPLRWIQLNAEEQDDLALFLSEVPLNLQDSSQGISQSECAKGSKDTVVPRNSHKSVEQLSGLRRTSSSVDESSWKIEVSDDIEADSRQSVEPMPEMRINPSILSRLWKNVESSRLRLFRNSSKKFKSEEQLQFRNGFLNYMDMKRIACLAQRISRLTERSRSCFKATSSQQLAARIEVVQRQIPGNRYQQFGPSLRLAFLLLLSIILIVPFVLYST
ncbi:uncharacterized protein LOC141847750 [Curcuma longa]|uniref:uncharacterized protein LOC141847750 n=1 Tax=Curcuma longa TaxID=136217 RepID=UPI003D9EF591